MMIATFCLAMQSDGLKAPPICRFGPNHLTKLSEFESESSMFDCLTERGPTSNGELIGQGGSFDSSGIKILKLLVCSKQWCIIPIYFIANILHVSLPVLGSN
jgi:hypothetical protein